MSFFKNLFGHHEAQNAHNQIYGGNQDYSSDYQQQNQGSFTHEVIAGAAGFAAMKAYEDHVRRTGEQVSHPMMKEMLAGFAAAEVDKLFETKGLDYLDREKAKQMAIQQAHHLAHEKYGSGGVYNGGNAQGQGQDYSDQGYGRGSSNNYQQDQSNNYNQGYGGENYGNQGSGGYQQQNYGENQGSGGYQQQNYGGNQGQQQQWGDGDEQPRPEHHRHHHRREEDD